MTAIYRVYGQVLASDFPFTTALQPGSGAPDLTFSRVFIAPDYPAWRDGTPALNIRNTLFIYCCETFDLFRIIDLADFYILSDAIVCHLHDAQYDYQVETFFLGVIFSYWLEKRGIRALHAAAVNLNGQAVAFLSTNSGGKSSLAATLVQMGYPLLSDDILGIQKDGDRFIAHPSFPQLRMWPDAAQHFVGSYEDLELAHPAYDKRRVPVHRLGGFCDKGVPLARVYLPERHENMDSHDIQIERIPPVLAVMDFSAYAFAESYLAATDLQAERFRFSAALTQAVPIYKLIYPSGFPRLRHVCQRILDLHTPPEKSRFPMQAER